MRRFTYVLLLALFFLSGSAGLMYEVVWTRKLTLLFGGTTYAITTTVAAFMAGLGLGSYIAGRIAHRLSATGRAYGVLQLAVGVTALAVPLLLRTVEPLYRAIYSPGAGVGLLTTVRFAGGMLVLMLPTTLMGATLPVLVRYVTSRGRQVGQSVGVLYGINTLGAVGGTLAAGFILLPNVGMNATTYVAAGLNFAVGAAAFIFLRGRKEDAAAAAAAAARREAKARKRQQHKAVTQPVAGFEPAISARAIGRAALLATGVSGMAGMIYQIAWTRTLVMSIGSTTYAFSCILAAFILGLGGGSLLV